MEHAKTLELEAKLGTQLVAQKRKLGAGVSATNVSYKKFRSTPSRELSINQTIAINKVRLDSLNPLSGFRFVMPSSPLHCSTSSLHATIFDWPHLFISD